jgi:integrase
MAKFRKTKKRKRGSGGLYRPPHSNNYLSVVSDGNGKLSRLYTRTSDFDEASKLHVSHQERINKGGLVENPKLTVSNLYEAYLLDSVNNGLKDVRNIKSRWKNHLQPAFGKLNPAKVTVDMHAKYVAKRKESGADNATINRESAILKKCFRLAMQREKINRVPYFQMLKEDNVRDGFLEDPTNHRVESAKAGAWMLGIFETGFTFGWRQTSVLKIEVQQIASDGSIRLNKTKTKAKPNAYMTPELRAALAPLMVGKSGTDRLFTRPDGSPVDDFRKTWRNVTKAAGHPTLLFHDLRRTAIRNMSRRGLSEKMIMQIAGLKTRAIFDRYNIICEEDLKEAARKMSVPINSTSAVLAPKSVQPVQLTSAELELVMQARRLQVVVTHEIQTQRVVPGGGLEPPQPFRVCGF